MCRPTAAHVLAVAALAAVATACNSSRTLEGSASAPACTRCHGGVENTTGAPPRDARGGEQTSLVTVGAHTSHLAAPHGIAAPVACESCHVVPSVFPEGSHGDGTGTVSFGAFARNGGVEPSWSPGAATCSVYCHGASLPGGSAASPVWTRVDGSQVQCASCHGAPPPHPHPQRSDCAACHPGTVQASGGIVPAGAHLDGDVDVDYSAMGCTDCHGDATRAASALVKAAPPIGTLGETAPSARAVGAHQAHLAKASLAQPVGCGECHAVPATPAHQDGAAQLTFGPLATPDAGASPTWDTDTLRCSGTYCHGATVAGGTKKLPGWTLGPNETTCGTCHGAPPPPPHTSGDSCHTCHPSTVREDGSIDVAGGAHVNGALEVERYHADGWDAPGVHGYAANRDLAPCKSCHGDDLTGGDVGISCDTCHAAAVADWRTTCTFCHGDAQRADAIEAAPPVGTEGELAASARAVGAHQSHLAAGTVSQGIACAECHAIPADILQPQHVDGTVDLTFGALATARGASASFDPVALTCTSYCHGATLHGGGVTEPLWTQVDGTQAACGTCHGTPPPPPHPTLTTCRACHSGTVLTDTPERTIDVAGGKHLNGVPDRTDYHPTGWGSRTVHGYEANRDFASCQACHGADFAGGGVGVSCNACHATNGHANWQTDCTFCHGDPARPTNPAAPPVGTEGESLPTERAVGAHAAHLAGAAMGKPIACAECHSVPTDLSHLNGTAALTWGPLATARGAAASFDPVALGCTSYCHGANLPGAANPAPVWTAASQATCGACHALPPPSPHPVVSGAAPASCRPCHQDTLAADGSFVPAGSGGRHVNGLPDARAHEASWTDPASPGFHAYEADEGLASCQACHGVNLDGPTAASACSACHGPSRPAPDLETCTGCHGGDDNATGAPPRTRWGAAFAADPVRTGAHTAHMQTTLAPQLDCDVCHAKPTTMFDAGHVDPSPAEVVFSGLASNGTTPAPWVRTSPSCGTVYCHGGTLDANGSNTAPLWTGGPGEATCGSCHGLPPTTDHPAVTGGLPSCNVCHRHTIDAMGAIIPPASGGLHLDGSAQATGGHEPAWSDPASTGFHAVSANQGLSSCQFCHGPNLDGVGGTTTVACADCHAGVAAPELTCTGCHGGDANSTGAPPRAQWAYRGVPAEAALRNGAHTTHVSPSPIAPPFDCDVCHARPATMFAPGHIDGSSTADVAFDLLAANGTTPAPWDRTDPTCGTVYCHGGTLDAGGSNTAPDWTVVGQGQAGCGTCHGTPPPDPHPAAPDHAACHDCHPSTIDAAGGIIPPATGGTHLNGQLDGGHLPSWSDPASPDFHAYSANRGLTSCRLCHGQNLDGVGGSTTVACADCHTGAAAPELTCTGCHGGVDNGTGAPPKATWGNRADTVRIGAHSSHVGTNPVSAPIACSACHTTPADMFAAGHLGPSRAEVVIQEPVSGLAPGVWNYPTTSQPTCSSTYCHGDFTRGNTTNQPDWTGTNQAACGTCHPTRPVNFRHNTHQRAYYDVPWWPLPGGSNWVTCDQCHSGIASSVNSTTPPALNVVDGSGPPLHVNGTTNVVFKAGGTYTKEPTQGACSGMACHPGETKYWPR